VAGCTEHGNEREFHEMWGVSCLTEEILGFQKGLYLMQMVINSRYCNWFFSWIGGKYDLLIAPMLKTTAFCNVTPCSFVVERYRCFGRSCCLAFLG
jgi:hypothetical protein